MKLLIVRHGESEGNVGTLVPDTKSSLTEKGRQQAQKLADKLKETQIDMAFVSSLSRAQQTAEIILQYHPEVVVTSTLELRERSHGTYEGKRPKEDTMKEWQASGLPFGEFKVEGGESWYEAGERIKHFLEELVRQYSNGDKTILIVGHGSTITYFLMHTDGKDVRANSKESYQYYHPDNTAMSVVEIDGKGIHKIAVLNDISHLE